jgi:Ser/Thr protein kinase RdoA (MazF antagonist)
MDHPEVAAVLRHYPIPRWPLRIDFLGNAGGFSGTRLWKLHLPSGRLCLRRWPDDYPDHERLHFIHSLLLHVARAGFRQAPVPLPTRDRQTFVTWQRHHYELTQWIDGRADYRDQPSAAKLTNALQTLAEFHVRAGTLTAHTRFGPSPGLARRFREVNQLLARELRGLTAVITRQSRQPLADASGQLLACAARALPALHRGLSAIVDQPLALQPCIRDVWHDHVLYAGQRVAGLVDFGACGVDSVSGDIARLLGSLAGDDPAGWCQGLAAYQAVRPLEDREVIAIREFDHANVVLSGIHWVRWIFVEHRQFDTSRVAARLAEIERRLRHHAPR